jgi:fructose/tagatose bisphosphate aldolase
MKINLRRAAKIASDIQMEISKINLQTEKKIVSNQAASAIVVKNLEITNFETSVNRLLSLTRVLYDVRREITLANAYVPTNTYKSINIVLTEMNSFKAQLSSINKLLSYNDISLNDSEWSSVYLADIERRKSPTYINYGSDNLTLCLMTETFKQTMKQCAISLKRDLDKMSDTLLYLNTTLDITIDLTDWTLLEGEGIV